VADQPSERVLYITIFNHKERTDTRVYTHNNEGDHFYSTETSLPVIDPKLGLLHIKLGDKIDTKGDLIASDSDILLKLRIHYQSILDQLRFTLINTHQDDKYRIENAWTMAVADTTSAPQDRREQTPGITRDTGTSLIRDFQYLQQGRFERIRRSLTVTRGQWVETYIHLYLHKTREMFNLPHNDTAVGEGEGEALAGKENAGGKRKEIEGREEQRRESHLQLGSNQESESGDVEMRIIEQLHDMELLLAREVEFWEEQLSSRVQTFVNSDDVLEKERLRIQMEWKANCQQQLDGDIRAMDARLDAAKLEVRVNGSDELVRKWQSTHDNIKSTWQAVLERFVDNPTTPRSSSPNLLHPSRLKTDFQRSAQAIEAIVGSSLLNTTSLEQLQRQTDRVRELATELEKTMFCMDHPAGHLARLMEYKMSRSKWVGLDMRSFTEPLEVYTHALGAMSDVIHVCFDYVYSEDRYARVVESIRNLPSVTSIYVLDSRQLPAIQRDTPLFINDYDRSNKIETFLHDNQLRLARTRRTHVFIDTGDYYPSVDPARLKLWRGSKIAVSFFGPPSGTLVLKLTHSSRDAAVTLSLILKEPCGSRTFEYPVPSSLTVTTVTLSSGPSDHPPFVPNTRNNLIIEVTARVWTSYVLQDIQLHDEAGNDYNPGSPEE
jgi:hypothetical protein